MVLTAYRCPAGKWTIGAGLTAASGVVKPHAGMTITGAEARQLLKQALMSNYEPTVRRVLGKVPQHAFVGAVSFHFNTGAIGRASWVDAYKAGDRNDVRRRLALWNRGGGRVLPGLKRRRREEADVILLDEWPDHLRAASDTASNDPQFASFVISVSADEVPQAVPGGRLRARHHRRQDRPPGRARVSATLRLTVDALIGKQTLSALQRELEARRKSKRGGDGAAGAGAALYLTWHYRELIAARVQGFALRLAGWLRSF